MGRPIVNYAILAHWYALIIADVIRNIGSGTVVELDRGQCSCTRPTIS